MMKPQMKMTVLKLLSLETGIISNYLFIYDNLNFDYSNILNRKNSINDNSNRNEDFSESDKGNISIFPGEPEIPPEYVN